MDGGDVWGWGEVSTPLHHILPANGLGLSKRLSHVGRTVQCESWMFSAGILEVKSKVTKTVSSVNIIMMQWDGCHSARRYDSGVCLFHSMLYQVNGRLKVGKSETETNGEYSSRYNMCQSMSWQDHYPEANIKNEETSLPRTHELQKDHDKVEKSLYSKKKKKKTENVCAGILCGMWDKRNTRQSCNSTKA